MTSFTPPSLLMRLPARDPQTGLPPLSLATLPDLPDSITQPTFSIPDLQPGIVHIGCGAFHRAHQALLTQRAIEVELASTSTPVPPAWGIVGVSLRTPGTLRALQQQDGLYTVLERGPDRTALELVGTVRDLVYAPDEPAHLFASLRDPAIRIVSLTVTATGYSLDPQSMRLDAQHPDIQDDLRRSCPRTAIGVLVRCLALRRARGLGPPVILSCDNLPGNGHALRQACIDFASLQDDALGEWIGRNVQFPCTMVDRIVPVTTDTDRHDVAVATGLCDAAPVSAEPFRQWVIEAFDGPRPQWEAIGAEFVADVAPWEASKLRLLNGGHLVVAYLGLLAGHETVASAVNDAPIGALALRFMLDEQMPTLPPSDHDIRAYAGQLIARWRNPGIAHRLDRVGRDGSAKLAGRLLASLSDNLRDGRPAPCTLLAIAAWMRCATGQVDRGRPLPLPLQDRHSALLRRVGARAAGEPSLLVDAFLALPEVFDPVWRAIPQVREGLIRAMTALHRGGVYAAIADCHSGERS